MSESLDMRELAARALARVGDDALACARRERSLLLRFAANRPTQATAVDGAAVVELVVVRDGRVGRASTNLTSDAALAECGRRACSAAEAAVRWFGAGEFPGFAGAAPAPEHDGHDADTAALRPASGADGLAAAFAVASGRGLEAHGIWTAAEEEQAILTSAGAEAVDATTDAFMKVICVDSRGRSGYAAGTAVAASSLRPRALAEQAAAKALVPGEPAVVAPGEQTVVFEAHAVGVLIDVLGSMAFNGLAHAEGRGALSGRLGRRVAVPAVNLSDSPRFPGTLQRGIDAEGTPKAPLPLIQDGIAHRVVHDRRSAAVAGAASTGHALEPAGSPGGPEPTNLVLAGGGASDEDELCAPVERGLYVTRLWYVNEVRPKETLVTAVTRDGTFLIEDGRLTRPVRDLRLTESVLGILSRVEALGARQQLTSDGEFYGRRLARAVACPPLRAARVRFTASAGS